MGNWLAVRLPTRPVLGGGRGGARWTRALLTGGGVFFCQEGPDILALSGVKVLPYDRASQPPCGGFWLLPNADE